VVALIGQPSIPLQNATVIGADTRVCSAPMAPWAQDDHQWAASSSSRKRVSKALASRCLSVSASGSPPLETTGTSVEPQLATLFSSEDASTFNYGRHRLAQLIAAASGEGHEHDDLNPGARPRNCGWRVQRRPCSASDSSTFGRSPGRSASGEAHLERKRRGWRGR